MSKDRTPIGTCPCPYRNCDKTVPVFKFQSKTDDANKQRFAGKLYLVCPTDGRSISAAPGRPQ